MVNDKKELFRYIWAFTLGDGSIHIDKRHSVGNARFSCGQLVEHEDYILWRANILSNVTSVRIHNVHYVTNSRPNNKPLLKTVTSAHPVFTEIHHRMYQNGVKRIDPHHIKWLDWEVLAILYQDDGCLWFSKARKNDEMYRPNVTIATNNFSYGENMMLSKYIYDKLGIHFNPKRKVRKSGIQWILELKRSDMFRFTQGIIPFVKPSFFYKVDLDRMNVSDFYKSDGDIVRSA